MPDPALTLAVVATFLLAGTVKGVVGLGLPSISLALLTVVTDLPSAMALMLVPSFATNVWQALAGGGGAGGGLAGSMALARRLWPFLATAGLAVAVGAGALARVDHRILSALLGLLLATYALVSLAGLRLAIGPRHERWAGPVIGTINGVFTGMTGAFVMPGVMFLQGIGLDRNALIQGMGMLFTVSTVALALALGGHGLLDVRLGALSLAALLPALVGMVIGQRIRRRLPEATFRRVFFWSLLVLGAYIAVGAIRAMA